MQLEVATRTGTSPGRFLKACFALAFLMIPGWALAASFQGLGTLPGGESGYSIPWDVDAAGSVVVGESTSLNGIEAFRWTRSTGMGGLGALFGGDFFSTALGVSANGQVIVGASRSQFSADRTEPFRWSESLGMVGLGDLPGGEYSGSAPGVSGDGSIVAGTSTSTFSPTIGEAFRWTESSGLVGLGGLPGGLFATGVVTRASSSGAVLVGWAVSPNGREAFRWTEQEGMVGLGDLPQGLFQSTATGVSADGSVVVGLAVNPGPTSFRWTADSGMVDLGRPPGGNRSAALGVSADGSVVVGDAGVNGELVPAIWDEANGMRNLIDVLSSLGLNPEEEGWNLEQATAVSGDGLTIVGWGYNPEGDQEAWVAYLGEPPVIEVPALSPPGGMALFLLMSAAAFSKIRPREASSMRRARRAATPSIS